MGMTDMPKMRDDSESVNNGNTSELRSQDVPAQGADAVRTGTNRVSCQVCGRRLVPLKTGLHRNHKASRSHEPYSYCKGSGYRAERWVVGQRLRHHGGSIWVVVEDRDGRWGDYLIRCVVGQRSLWRDEWVEAPGREMVTHGEYMHRHGWKASS